MLREGEFSVGGTPAMGRKGAPFPELAVVYRSPGKGAHGVAVNSLFDR